jgi:hypothetical protein
MDVFYDHAVMGDFVYMQGRHDWDREYRRPPRSGSSINGYRGLDLSNVYSFI